MPETVGQSRREQFGHLAALLRGESRIVFVGRRILDEDDIHADLRAVAAQESRHNNAGVGHIDL